MEEREFKNRDAARVFGGLIIICIGVALLLRNLGYFVPAWLFTWPMILIIVGLYSSVKHNFRHPAGFVLIGIGSFFLVTRFIPELRLSPAFWPVFVIALGLYFIIRPRRMRGGRATWKTGERSDELVEYTEAPNPADAERGDTVKIDSVFSGVDRAILSKNFKGGRISCVFGGAEIDLLQAELAGTAVLKMDVVFGGAKLILPAHWNVQSEIDGVFHSVEDKRKYNPAVGSDNSKLLILKGSCVFGGIEIKSY